MVNRVLALLAVLVAASCGSSSDSVSCNNEANFSCSTISVTGGTLTEKTCTSGVMVSSCSTANVIGRCTLNGLFGGAACPSGATCSSFFVVYMGGDAAGGQAGCTQVGGTWSTN